MTEKLARLKHLSSIWTKKGKKGKDSKKMKTEKQRRKTEKVQQGQQCLKKLQNQQWEDLKPLQTKICIFHLHPVFQNTVTNRPLDRSSTSVSVLSRQLCWFNSSLLFSFVSLPSRRSAASPESQTGTPQRPQSLVDVGPQGLVKSLEVGSVLDVATPATHHQLKERRWAEGRGVEEDLVVKWERGTEFKRANFNWGVKTLRMENDF